MSSKENDDVINDEKEFPFIKEKIVTKKRKKRKIKVLCSVLFTMILAVLFGVICRIAFEVSEPFVCKILGKSVNQKVVTFPTVSSSADTSPVTVEDLEAIDEDTNKDVNKDTNKEDTSNTSEKDQNYNQDNDVKVETIEQDTIFIKQQVEASIKDYISMHDQVKDIVNEVNQSIVTVSGVKSGVDWFRNTYEIMDVTTGIIIANNREELLILTSKDKIIDANNIIVSFATNVTVSATIKGFDSDTGLAVVAVDLSLIPKNTLEQTEVAVLGETLTFSIGDPIIALGSPNGYAYSMGLGIITTKINPIYITDNKLDLFNTDIEDNPNAEGVITNLKGEVIGIITQKFKKDLNKNLNTVLAISKIKPIIEKLVNETSRIYVGVVATDLTAESAESLGTNSGIYVTEVETDSPAFDAGIQSGDVILKINDSTISSVTVFNNILGTYKPKDTVSIVVKRNVNSSSKEKELKVTIVKKKN